MLFGVYQQQVNLSGGNNAPANITAITLEGRYANHTIRANLSSSTSGNIAMWLDGIGGGYNLSPFPITGNYAAVTKANGDVFANIGTPIPAGNHTLDGIFGNSTLQANVTMLRSNITSNLTVSGSLGIGVSLTPGFSETLYDGATIEFYRTDPVDSPQLAAISPTNFAWYGNNPLQASNGNMTYDPEAALGNRVNYHSVGANAPSLIHVGNVAYGGGPLVLNDLAVGNYGFAAVFKSTNYQIDNVIWPVGAAAAHVYIDKTTPNVTISGGGVHESANVVATLNYAAAGNVAFYDGATLLGESAISDNVATLDLLTTGAGNYSITGSYSSNATFNAANSTGNITTEHVTTTVSQTIDSSTYGNFTWHSSVDVDREDDMSSTVFPAVYNWRGAWVDHTTYNNDDVVVQFTYEGVDRYNHIYKRKGGSGTQGPYDGSIYWETLSTQTVSVSGGIYSFNGNTAAAGNYVVVSHIGQDANHAANFAIGNVTLEKADITINSVQGGGVYGQTANVSATLSANVGGTVSFYEGANFLGNVSDSAELSLNTLGVGPHTIIANYTHANYTAANASNEITIGQASLSIVLGGSVTGSGAADLSAALTPAFDGLSIEFVSNVDGSQGTANSASGYANKTVSGLAQQSHDFTAAWAGDANIAANTSSPLTLDLT